MKKLAVLPILLIVIVSVVVYFGLGAGLLRVTITATPEALDPAIMIAADNDLKVEVNLYDFLVYPSAEDGSPQPYVAESWKLGEDNKTWTFRLRPGITFHDGTDLTAEDVKFSLDRMIVIGEGFGVYFANVVDNVTVLDTYEVAITLKEPYGPFLTMLYNFGILSKDLVMSNLKEGVYGEYGDYATEYLIEHEAGSGPYVLEDYSIRNYMYLSKNRNYWQEIPAEAPDGVEIRQVRDPSLTKMLMGSGEVDLVHGRQQQTTLDALTAMPGVSVARLHELSVNYFMIHTKKPPTDDVHFRKAMAWATDYAGMMAIYPGTSRAYGPVPPGILGFSDDFDHYEYNIAKAREELELSPYYDDLDSYTVDIGYVIGNGDTEMLAMVLASNLVAVGINARVVASPWVLFQNNIQAIETTPYTNNFFAGPLYPDAGSCLEFKYASWTTGGWNQIEWLQDEYFDAALLDAFCIMDDDARASEYAELQRYIVEDVCPSIFTFLSVLNIAYRADRFAWPTDTPEDALPYNIAQFNFNFMHFTMKEDQSVIGSDPE